MKLTKEERKFHHKLSKWLWRNELDSAEHELVAELRHQNQIGKTDVSINLEKISEEIIDDYLDRSLKFETEPLDADDLAAIADSKARFQEEIIKGFKKLQERGFIEVVSSKDWKEHIVNVIPVWEKKNENSN